MTAERLQRVAASAASLQVVQEALTTAFPPSQGSAKRAEKLKQFFSDVMPAGSGFKVRDPTACQFSRGVKLRSCLASVQQFLWSLIELPLGAINRVNFSQAEPCLVPDARLSIAGAASLKCCLQTLLHAQSRTEQNNGMNLPSFLAGHDSFVSCRTGQLPSQHSPLIFGRPESGSLHPGFSQMPLAGPCPAAPSLLSRATSTQGAPKSNCKALQPQLLV